MTNIQPEPLGQETEVLYWLDLAKRILGGEMTPDEARLALKSSVPYIVARREKRAHALIGRRRSIT